MKKTFLFVVLALLLALSLVACGGGDSTEDSSSGTGPSVSNGEALFAQTTIGSASAPGCITCHSLEAGVTLVGPAQNDIGTRATGRVAGVSGEDYLRQSIVEPDVYIVDGFSAGLMYQNYANELSDSEIDDLVAYLLTLK